MCTALCGKNLSMKIQKSSGSSYISETKHVAIRDLKVGILCRFGYIYMERERYHMLLLVILRRDKLANPHKPGFLPHMRVGL